MRVSWNHASHTKKSSVQFFWANEKVYNENINDGYEAINCHSKLWQSLPKLLKVYLKGIKFREAKKIVFREDLISRISYF